MKFSTLFILAVLFSFHSTEAAKKKTKPKKIVAAPVVLPPKPSYKKMPLCTGNETMPGWSLILDRSFIFPTKFVHPANYRLAMTNDTLLKTYLKSIPFDSGNNKIILPTLIDQTLQCLEFTIQRTETMDEELQLKYPELMSFKAFEEKNHLNVARIDCDGVNTKIMITYNNKVYYLTSLLFHNYTYYVAYTKDDPNFQKENIEGRR